MNKVSFKRVFTGRALVAVLLLGLVLFGIAMWFMVGQGYDRATARIVPQAALAIIPVLSAVLYFHSPTRQAMELVFGRRPRFLGGWVATMAFLFGLLMATVGLAWALVFLVLKPASPFQELWYFLGGTTMLTGGILYAVYAPVAYRALYALSILIGYGAVLVSVRSFILAFFG